MSRGPLDGLRVIDASRILAGPMCAQILGDLGAEVVKIEKPGVGDDTRQWGPPFVGPLSAYFLSCNRNKKSVTLDLAHADGKKVFDAIVEKSDVLIENYRADSALKLGLDPASLLAKNPRLVLCSISGFGRTGPLADLPGYDLGIQAMSGLMDITGPKEGPPAKVGVAIADVVTGLYAAIAILACLRERDTTGKGYAIDLALLDCALASQVNVAQAYLSSGDVPPRQGNAHLQIVPYQPFETADDWLILMIGNDGQWRHFCEAAERPDLAADPRFVTNPLRIRHREALIPLVAETMRGRGRAEWETRLESAGVPFAPVWNYAQLFAQPQVAERGMKVTVRDAEGRPVDLIGSPLKLGDMVSSPPTLGRDTDAVLRSLAGLSDPELDRLRERGVI